MAVANAEPQFSSATWWTESERVVKYRVQISFQTENKESKKWFAPDLTLRIGNLEHKPKASHSQITEVGL